MGRSAAPEVEPQDELGDARKAHRALLERIGDGDPVTPGELLEAEGAVKVAEARAGLVARRQAEEAARARQARAAELMGSLRDGHLHGQAAALADAHNAAVEALVAYRSAAEGFVAEVMAAARELVGLRPLPDGVKADWNGRAATVRAGGEVFVVAVDWPAKLVTQAAADALSGPDRKKVLAQISHPSPLEALRLHWGA